MKSPGLLIEKEKRIMRYTNEQLENAIVAQRHSAKDVAKWWGVKRNKNLTKTQKQVLHRLGSKIMTAKQLKCRYSTLVSLWLTGHVVVARTLMAMYVHPKLRNNDSFVVTPAGRKAIP
jgi:hypothetical protein